MMGATSHAAVSSQLRIPSLTPSQTTRSSSSRYITPTQGVASSRFVGRCSTDESSPVCRRRLTPSTRRSYRQHPAFESQPDPFFSLAHVGFAVAKRSRDDQRPQDAAPRSRSGTQGNAQAVRCSVALIRTAPWTDTPSLRLLLDSTSCSLPDSPAFEIAAVTQGRRHHTC